MTDDTLRGIVVGGMFAVGAGSLFVVFVGLLIEAESSSGATGNVLIAAGIAGIVSAALVAHGVARGASVKAVVAAVFQALVAASVLAWWLASDVWSGTAHASLSTVVLVAVIALDALAVLWALKRIRER